MRARARCCFYGILLAPPMLAACVLPAYVGENEPAPAPPSTEQVACGESRPVDILFVVDNSGSMSEEQTRLARAVSSAGDPANRCRGFELEALAKYAGLNCARPVAEWDPPYPEIMADCGLVERLQVARNRFHIGVLSTDLGNCDRPYGSDADRGSVPQRGCLQTALGYPELAVLTWETPEASQRLAEIVTNLGIYGSAYEKGLDAALHFLTPGHDTPPAGTCELARDCSGDLDAFWRYVQRRPGQSEIETRLVVVIVSDEDDCSHGGAIDESVSGNSDLCYTEPGRLKETGLLVEHLLALKGREDLVSLVVLGGFHDSGGVMYPAGCKMVSGRSSDDCQPSGGNSVATCTVCVDNRPVCPCHPQMTCPGGSVFETTNCCQAEAASRYHAAAGLLDKSRFHSLCAASYQATIDSVFDFGFSG